MNANVETKGSAKAGGIPWGSLAMVSKVKRALSRTSLTLHSVIKRPRERIAADRTVLKKKNG